MVKKKIFFLIQSRIFSTRLPGKTFFTFFNETILDRVIRIANNCVDKNTDKHCYTDDRREES